jgi:hypothetical protein
LNGAKKGSRGYGYGYGYGYGIDVEKSGWWSRMKKRMKR